MSRSRSNINVPFFSKKKKKWPLRGISVLQTQLILKFILFLSPADNFLLFTDTAQSSIYIMDIDSQTYKKIPVSTSNPIAVDYDPVLGDIYWTDVSQKLIKTAALDGSNEKVLYSPGSSRLSFVFISESI